MIAHDELQKAFAKDVPMADTESQHYRSALPSWTPTVIDGGKLS